MEPDKGAMDPRVAELLARMAEVSDDQLSDFEDMVVGALEEAAEAKDVATARAYADALETIRSEQSERIAQAEAKEAEIAAIMQRVKGSDAEAPDPDDADPDAEADDPSADADADPDADAPAEAPGVEGNRAAAAARPLPKISDLTRSRRVNPKQATERKTGATVVTAAVDVPGITAGTEIGDKETLRRAIFSRWQTLSGSQGLSGRIPVARITTEFPDDRILHSGDEEGNYNKLDKVLSPDALVASGGICAPVASSYDMLTLANAGRPLRDSLPRFGAERGGIRFIQASSVSDVAGAVDHVTEAEDTSGATKACLTITCEDVTEVLLSAVSRCLQFGNFNARTHPENVAHLTDLTVAAHARRAENELWDAMCSASTAVTSGEGLSAYRDVYATLARAAAQYRNRHRMSTMAVLRWVAPAWLADLLSADLVRQMPGDGTQAVARATMEEWFRRTGIAVTWTNEGGSAPDQVFATQGAGALLGWPSTVETLLYAEGTFLFLDGGTLDIGVVRDSSLILANDFQLFAETFENVAMVGPESLCLTLDICPSGLSSGQDDSFDPCTLGS
jgi:hypothetical protein